VLIVFCSDSEGGIPDTKKPVNNNEAFVTVVRTTLNKHSLGKWWLNNTFAQNMNTSSLGQA